MKLNSLRSSCARRIPAWIPSSQKPTPYGLSQRAQGTMPATLNQNLVLPKSLPPTTPLPLPSPNTPLFLALSGPLLPHPKKPRSIPTYTTRSSGHTSPDSRPKMHALKGCSRMQSSFSHRRQASWRPRANWRRHGESVRMRLLVLPDSRLHRDDKSGSWMQVPIEHATLATEGPSSLSCPLPLPRLISQSRHLAIVGNGGHVATFDWQAGTMHAELQLRETCRDITFVPHPLCSQNMP